MITLTPAKSQPKLSVPREILGHFIESGFGRQVPGMWAEMIFNRAFRDVSPYSFFTWEWLGFERPMYNDHAPFWHSGYEEYDWELFGGVRTEQTHGSNAFKGKQSLRLTNEGGPGGLRQRGIYLEADRSYTFRLFGSVQGAIRMAGLDGFEGHYHDGAFRDVNIRFADMQGTPVIQKMVRFGPTQAEQSFSFAPDVTGTVTLEIATDWEGSILLSWVSLMPDDNQKGWRSDVVDLLKKVQVPLVRFPGGCFVSFYDWESSIGPRERRDPMESHYWGGLEENDVGLDELMDLADMVGFKPQICFNMMSSTPFKARQMVEYLNADSTVGMGRLRLLNGYPEPRGARLFEMDNEPWRKWSPLQYAQACVEFGAEMRLADPDIELMMACYGYPNEALRPMLDIAGGTVNYIIQRRGDPDFVAENLDILRRYNADTGHDVKLVNTEWLPSCETKIPFEQDGVPMDFNWGRERITNDYTHSFGFFQIRWFYALNGAARILDYMGYGGEFASANFNNCCNTWGQNIINASKEKAWLSCAGEMFAFFGRHFIEGVPFNLETNLDGLSAQLLEGGGQKRLFIVNNTGKAQDVALDGSWSGEILSGPSQLACITQTDNPLTLKSVKAQDAITVPAWSITALGQ